MCLLLTCPICDIDPSIDSLSSEVARSKETPVSSGLIPPSGLDEAPKSALCKASTPCPSSTLQFPLSSFSAPLPSPVTDKKTRASQKPTGALDKFVRRFVAGSEEEKRFLESEKEKEKQRKEKEKTEASVQLAQTKRQKKERVSKAKKRKGALVEALRSAGRTKKEICQTLSDEKKLEKLRDEEKVSKLDEEQKKQVISYIRQHELFLTHKLTPSTVIAHFNNCYPKTIGIHLRKSTVYDWLRKLEKDPSYQPGSGYLGNSHALRFSDTFRSALLAIIRRMRDDACPIYDNICRAIGLSLLQEKDSSGEYLFPDRKLLDDGKLCLSLSWCRSFMHDNHLVSRAVTTARRADMPAEYCVEKGKEFAMRLAIHVSNHRILKSFIYHWDETALPFIIVCNRTRETKGAKKVSMVGYGNKRQITGAALVTMAGELVSMLTVFKGSTTRCLPNGYLTSSRFGVRCTCTDSHWISVDVQKTFITLDLEPHLLSQAQKQVTEGAVGDIKNVHFILILDVYSTHISAEFTTWFHQRYNGKTLPYGHLVYVPANLTSMYQPADLTLQRRIKSFLKEKGAWFIASRALSEAELDMKLEVLKARLLEWLKELVVNLRAEEGAELIRKGFTQAKLDRIFSTDFQTEAKLHSDTLFGPNSTFFLESESDDEEDIHQKGILDLEDNGWACQCGRLLTSPNCGECGAKSSSSPSLNGLSTPAASPAPASVPPVVLYSSLPHSSSSQ